MRGELDFADVAARARRDARRACPSRRCDEVRADGRAHPGRPRAGRRVPRRAAGRSALVSGGFAEIVEPLAARARASRYFRANRLEVADGVLTGRITGPVVDRAAKAATLREFAAAEGVAAGAHGRRSATARTTST